MQIFHWIGALPQKLFRFIYICLFQTFLVAETNTQNIYIYQLSAINNFILFYSNTHRRILGKQYTIFCFLITKFTLIGTTFSPIFPQKFSWQQQKNIIFLVTPMRGYGYLYGRDHWYVRGGNRDRNVFPGPAPSDLLSPPAYLGFLENGLRRVESSLERRGV